MADDSLPGKLRPRVDSAPGKANLKVEDQTLLLCLFCREKGHSASQCHTEEVEYELDWYNSEAREALRFDDADSVSDLCLRCQDLDLPTWLLEPLPIQSDQDLRHMISDERIFRNLGSVESIVLRDDCTLCRCIFAMTANACSLNQEVKLVKSSSTYRLEAGILLDTPQKRANSQYVSVILDPTETGLYVDDLVSTRGDGLCAIAADSSQTSMRLSAREIDTQRIDMQVIRQWLSTCERLHPFTCKMPGFGDIQTIRLIDTRSRLIVPYSPQTSEYLALSYVWGAAEQNIPNAGQPGTLLEKLCPTIEDALTFTNDLGKQYLWVDSVCINQSDVDQKLQQISIMSEIYQRAYATIIAFSGRSANSGLPRVGSTNTPYRQLKCLIQETRFVGLGPTLSQLVWVLPWGQRAWTFQEAILSSRCIYISKYQVHFECNAMICCETLDESSSWLHQTARDDNFFKGENTTINTGVLRSPFATNRIFEKGEFGIYSTSASLFSRRSLTLQSDALLAFSGILQALQRSAYTEGFFWGLPYRDLDWALLWDGVNVACRRKDFPTWSWLSWQGHIWPGQPNQLQNLRQCPLDLTMWKFSDRAEKIFESSYQQERLGGRSSLGNDPVAELAGLQETEPYRSFPTNLDVTPSRLPSVGPLRKSLDQSSQDTDHRLCIEGCVLRFSLASCVRKDIDDQDYSFFRMRTFGVTTFVKVIKTSILNKARQRRKDREFLLLAREIEEDKYGVWIRHFLLLLKPTEEGLKRSCTVLLDVNENDLGVLHSFNICKRRVILI